MTGMAPHSPSPGYVYSPKYVHFQTARLFSPASLSPALSCLVQKQLRTTGEASRLKVPPFHILLHDGTAARMGLLEGDRNADGAYVLCIHGSRTVYLGRTTWTIIAYLCEGQG
jgi:hypothetical protein